MNAVYNIFHKDKVDTRRDINVRNIRNVVENFAADLKSPTIYLSTIEELNECLSQYPQVRFNPSPDTTRVFPGRTGAAGLWIGTYLAYKNFLATNADVLFIFEDDIKISANFGRVVNLYSSELPEDWDILSLLTPWDTIRSRYTANHDIPDKKYICLIYQDWSTGAYMISRKAATFIVNDIETNGISHPIDFYLFNYRYNNQPAELTFRSFNIRPSRYVPVKLAPESNISYIGAMEVYQA